MIFYPTFTRLSAPSWRGGFIPKIPKNRHFPPKKILETTLKMWKNEKILKGKP